MMQTDSAIRAPAVAGAFYPGDADTLDRMIDGFLDRAETPPLPAKAIVAPHAGYVYSGPIAGSSYAAVRHLKDRVRRVVLLGPAHRCGFTGMAVPSAAGLATPLGVVPVDRDGVAIALSKPGVQTLDRAFDGEHSLEVQLPFIQKLFPEASVVPLIVGDASAPSVDAVLEALWGGPETLIVVSSDLSHYQDYETARRIDLATSQAIEALVGDRLGGSNACGIRPLAGLLLRAQALDLRVTTRDLRNSGDTAGDKSRVVGYGAYSFEPAEEASLSQADRAMLFAAALDAVGHVVKKGRPPTVTAGGYSWPLRAIRRTFVTLEIGGRLRGCIGTVIAHRPLIEDVVMNACRSAVEDPRFPPMTAEEVEQSALTVSILSHDRPMNITSNEDLLAKLRPGTDGLILRDRHHAALFLPKVWDSLPNPVQFVTHLKLKAGLSPDHFSPTLQAFCFTTETFGSK